MAPQPPSRSIGELTSPEVTRCLKETSILCLPLGAIEQHGAAPAAQHRSDRGGRARRGASLRSRGDAFDLWHLPALPLGLSREHDWAPGTLSLSMQNFAAVLREYAREIVRALPARNLVIVNCHGGNRGILENLLHEMRGDFALNACAIHPFDLAKVDTGPSLRRAWRQERNLDHAGARARSGSTRNDKAAGKPARSQKHSETDLRSRCDLAVADGRSPDREGRHHRRRRGTLQPELGEAIIDSVVQEAVAVFQRLLENQKLMPGGGAR